MKAIILTKSLKKLVQTTKGFVKRTDAARPAENFIRLEFSKEFSLVTAVAIDGFRMSVEHSDCFEIDEDFTAYIKFDIPKGSRDSYAAVEVKDGTCFIEVDGQIIGYKQPSGEFIEWRTILDGAKNKPETLRIGFNGEYLLSALQAAKISSGGLLERPVVLEFRGPLDPVLLKTNEDNWKMVLPVRLKGDD